MPMTGAPQPDPVRTFTLPADLAEGIARAASRRGAAPQDIVEAALRRYVETDAWTNSLAGWFDLVQRAADDAAKQRGGSGPPS